MENGGAPGPFSPKVDHEKEEEVAVDEKMDDEEMPCGDLEVEEVNVVKQGMAQQKQEVNGNSAGPSSRTISNHEQVEVSEEELFKVTDEKQGLGEVPRPPQNAPDNHEVIDLTEDDDVDVDYKNVSSSTGPMENDGVKLVIYDLTDWNESDVKYPLWHYSSKFKELAKPFRDIAEKYGGSCYRRCRDDFNRDPTILEFANYCLSEGLPDQNWYGELVFVDSERRGMPLQYRSAGKVFIESLTTESSSEKEKVNWSYVVGDELRAPKGPNADDIKLWQFHITEIGRWEQEFWNLETSKNLLATVRKLMDSVWFPSDPESFLTFFNHVLYERLSLIFYLENQSPTSGVLSDLDRSKIISAIKHYHHLKNSAIKIYPSKTGRKIKDEDDVELEDEDEDVIDLADDDGEELRDASNSDPYSADDEMLELDELDLATVKFEMDLKRHTLEMSFLLSPAIRPLLPFISSTDECDPGCVNPDEVILVLKETNLRTLKHVYEELEKYGVKEEANIRILPDFEMALKKSIAGTTVFVSSGNYNISGLRRLSDGGSIIGLKTANADVTVRPSDDIGDVWLFVDGPDEGILKLANISLVVDTSTDEQLKTMIYVKSGQLSLENCALRDNNPSSRDVPVRLIEKSENATVKADESCVFSNVENLSLS